MKLNVFLGIICFGVNSAAETVHIDPGAADTSFFYNSYEIPGFLKGKRLAGQMISLDFYFSNDKQVRAHKVEIELAVAQDDKIGFWPQGVSTVTGYLISSDGTPLTDVVIIPNTMSLPAQFWPVSVYRLPDGTKYLPSQTGYRVLFTGTRLKPLFFSGIHFDVQTPILPGRRIIGCRLTLSNYHDYNARTGTWRNPIRIIQKASDHIIPKPSNYVAD